MPGALFRDRAMDSLPLGSLLDGQGIIGRVRRHARALLFYRTRGEGFTEHLEIGRNFPRGAGFINITALKEQEPFDCGSCTVKALSLPKNGSPAKGVIGIEYKFPSSPGHSMELFIDGDKDLVDELGEHLLSDPWMPIALLGDMFPDKLKVLFDENPMERYSRSMLMGEVSAQSAGHLLIRQDGRLSVLETHVGGSAPASAIPSIPGEDLSIQRPEGSGVIRKAAIRRLKDFSVLSFTLDYGEGSASATIIVTSNTARSIIPFINAQPDFMLDIFKGIFPKASGTLKPSVSEDFRIDIRDG